VIAGSSGRRIVSGNRAAHPEFPDELYLTDKTPGETVAVWFRNSSAH